MFKEYFYRGRHRIPSTTAKRVVVIATSIAVPAFGMAGTAYAETPDWGPIIACESGGNHQAKNPNSTASGLYQFVNSTWAAYGGLEFAPTARQATAAEQTIVANRAYADAGYSPWNASKSCWQGKVGSGTPATVPTPKAPVPAPAPAPKTTPVIEPANDPVTAIVPADSVPTLGTEGGYTVVSGDTLSGIAAPLGITWQELYEKNRDVVEHADWIFPGEKLNLN